METKIEDILTSMCMTYKGEVLEVESFLDTEDSRVYKFKDGSTLEIKYWYVKSLSFGELEYDANEATVLITKEY
jgi:hypothetical protein